MASRDTATIGGMVGTNTGGVHVLRYGPMRNQVLGLEAVLADGTVVGRIPGLRKDNTGYDLAGLLTGSEGTLAVITRVHLALVPYLSDRVVALCAFDGFADTLTVSAAVRKRLDSLFTLEVFFAEGVSLVREHTGLGLPFDRPTRRTCSSSAPAVPAAPVASSTSSRTPSASARRYEATTVAVDRRVAPSGHTRASHRSDQRRRDPPQAGCDVALRPARRLRRGGARPPRRLAPVRVSCASGTSATATSMSTSWAHRPTISRSTTRC